MSVHGTCSTSRPVAADVLKGPVLGPVVCLVCRNDLPVGLLLGVTLYLRDIYLVLVVVGYYQVLGGVIPESHPFLPVGVLEVRHR